MDEKIFLVEEIKDINLEIGAANYFCRGQKIRMS